MPITYPGGFFDVTKHPESTTTETLDEPLFPAGLSDDASDELFDELDDTGSIPEGERVEIETYRESQYERPATEPEPVMTIDDCQVYAFTKCTWYVIDTYWIRGLTRTLVSHQRQGPFRQVFLVMICPDGRPAREIGPESILELPFSEEPPDGAGDGCGGVFWLPPAETLAFNPGGTSTPYSEGDWDVDRIHVWRRMSLRIDGCVITATYRQFCKTTYTHKTTGAVRVEYDDMNMQPIVRTWTVPGCQDRLFVALGPEFYAPPMVALYQASGTRFHLATVSPTGRPWVSSVEARWEDVGFVLEVGPRSPHLGTLAFGDHASLAVCSPDGESQVHLQGYARLLPAAPDPGEGERTAQQKPSPPSPATRRAIRFDPVCCSPVE